MKFRVAMKDPDALSDAIKTAVRDEVERLYEDLAEDEREDLIETRREKVAAICKTWFRYGEYITVEIDTEAKACVIVKER